MPSKQLSFLADKPQPIQAPRLQRKADAPTSQPAELVSITGRGTFRTLLVDPPWPERGSGKSKRGADRHYPLMTVRAIKALPVGEIAAPDAHLHLWATGNYLADAIDCARAWGFRVLNFRPWVKAEATGITSEVTIWKPQKTGLGQYMRCDAEILLLCVRGLAMVPRWKPRQTIYAPRGRHSEKPACVYADIERTSPAPRIELFARAQRAGWHSWGNEVTTP